MAIGRKDWFTLNPESIYLTHGTFGACLKVAFNSRIKWQEKLESDPFNFLNSHAINALEYSRKALGNYLNCNHNNLVYFPNPSTALNAVIKSLKLKNGDQVLSSNHEYGSLDRTWKYYSDLKGYDYKKVNIHIPYDDEKTIIDIFLNAITDKTKIIYLSHITSSTALIFPVKKICQIARDNNIISIIDGAHAPGQVPVDILDINPDIYVGACHKWMCSPKGASFLYAKKEIQNTIDPLVISWGWESETPSSSKFLDYHQYQGTNDVSAYLTIPTILDFFKKHHWFEIQNKCHELVLEAKNMLHDYNQDFYSTTNNENHFGQMLSFKINQNSKLLNEVTIKPSKILEIQTTILNHSNIRIPIIVWENQVFTRISIQAYNTIDDVKAMIQMLNYFNLL